MSSYRSFGYFTAVVLFKTRGLCPTEQFKSNEIFCVKTCFFMLGDATSKEIANMMAQLNTTERLLNQTRKLAAEQLAEAERAYKAAAERLTTVEGLRLPNIDPQQVRFFVTPCKMGKSWNIAVAYSRGEGGGMNGPPPLVVKVLKFVGNLGNGAFRST